jgi:DNA-binding NarL/FixJ family response regulator
MAIHIIIADDHQIVRQGLKALIEKEPDMEVVAEADSGRKTVNLVREVSPNVVIMDVNMPDINGIEASRQILAELPEVKVIALSMHADYRFVRGMLSAGARSYLLKECAFEELIKAIRQVMANKTHLSPGVAKFVAQDRPSRSDDPRQFAFGRLSAREIVVLQLMAEGKSTSQIADLLFISVKTVETHRQRIMEKVGTRSVAELTKYAIRAGLSALEG